MCFGRAGRAVSQRVESQEVNNVRLPSSRVLVLTGPQYHHAFRIAPNGESLFRQTTCRSLLQAQEGDL